MKTLLIYSLLILNCHIVFGQEYPDWVKNQINKQLIDFNDTNARKDILQGKINLILLGSNHYSYGIDLPNDQLKSIEKRFGFTYKYKYLESPIPKEFLFAKQEEYNNIVYKYLDSINRIDSRNEIEMEILRFQIENKLISLRTDKQLENIVRKEFKGKDKKQRGLLLKAEIHYRDRKFENALEIYNQLENEISTDNAKRLILNSKYHCLMNLYKYSEALLLIESDTNKWINKRIKK